MKTINIKFWIICLILITGFTGAYNSVDAQSKKETRKARKEAEKAMLVANFHAQDTVFNLKAFVLEADYLRGRRGEMIPVSSKINFVSVIDAQGTLQTGANGFFGSNGLGGQTVQGNISNYKVSGNTKSLTHNISFDLVSPVGTFNIVMNIMANNTASATITGTNSTRLTWQGNVVALFNTDTFQGESSYRR